LNICFFCFIYFFILLKWAKKRVEYLNSLPKQQGLFQDEVIIHDKCSSGYCGT
jgi:hypothetical protein